MQQDKRRHYRLPVEAPCVLKIVRDGGSTQDAASFKGVLKDISVGGLLVNTDTLREGDISIFPEAGEPGVPKPKPRTLLIKFSLPDEKMPFVVYFEPRWYDHADLSDPYEYQIGGRIIRIGKGDMERLQNYVRTHGHWEDLLEYRRRYKVSPASPDGFEKVEKGKRSNFYDAVLPLQFQIISAKDGRRTSRCRTTTHQVSLSGVNAEVSTINVDGVDMVFDDSPMKRNYLEMELAIPGQTDPVSATGEVHWVERFPSKDGYKYNVGIKFLKISSKDLGIIAKHLKGKPVAEDMANKGR